MKLRVRNWSLPTGLYPVLLLTVLLTQGCMDRVNGEEDKDETESALAIPVEAAKVATSDMAAFYTGTATLEADKQATDRPTHSRRTQSQAFRMEFFQN